MKSIKSPNVWLSLFIFGILCTVLYRYPVVEKVYYLFIIVLFFMLIIQLLKILEYSIGGNILFLSVIVIGLVYILVCSFGNITFFANKYSWIFMLMFYLYFCFMERGLGYAEKLYKQLTILLNIFSVLNIYQILFHKPLLINYMKLIEVDYDFYQFGSFAYRTMSVFNHPIISGLFFVIAFLCNMYVLKTSWKYPLQALLLLNIYTSWSRSSWLALVIILVIYLLLNISKFKFTLKLNITYRKIFNFYILLIFLSIGLIFLLANFDSLYNSIASRIGDSLSTNSTDGSNLQRTMTISLILNHMFEGDIVNLLFGYGIGSVEAFMLAHPILIEDFSTTDNQFLSWFYEFGLVGIVSYFACLIFLFISYLRNRGNWVKELSLLCLIVINIELFFFDAIGWPVVYVMFVFATVTLAFKFKPENKQVNKISN